jgi:anti-anti-sigma factor
VSSAVEHFAVEYIDDGFAVTIRAVGELDTAAAGLLSAEFDRAMESSAGDVTVNLSAVTFMDSTGLSALLRAHAALGARSIAALSWTLPHPRRHGFSS